jgi:hypothetical protein
VGLEATCPVTVGPDTWEAKVVLETDELRVRGDRRVVIPLREVERAEAARGRLTVVWPGGEARFDLGDAAERWAQKIRSPKSLIDKLDVKPGARVVVLGVEDAAFRADLAARTSDVATRLRKDADVIFFAAATRAELGKLGKLRYSLVPTGAIWVVRPKGTKGTKAITDADVIAAGKAAGLVDTKVAKFSETHTAEKLVIPVAGRRPPRLRS